MALPLSWLIPAWAGKTRAIRCPRGRRAAHPRVGGENVSERRPASARMGSSPRGRGKRHVRPHVFVVERLIPAWAGKTSSPSHVRPGRPAHPRVGGENPNSTGTACGASGSSPRGRGKPLDAVSLARPARLIPAWAGKTVSRPTIRYPDSAHPRVGGENIKSMFSSVQSTGSSPRGRGKPTVAPVHHASGRLIPAWAGKTAPTCAAAWPVPAHPRVGGENTPLTSHPGNSHGSSPRGRGKPSCCWLVSGFRGLIPAWAGKTVTAWAFCPIAWAHPRVGGENEIIGFVCARATGSSPRGRGKHRRTSAARRGIGLIPAWAGKT